ncbi:hypothetical protein SUGI_1089300 [Cryptomeria japonica]|nr:hypothetical protein SUGI_1089300 [Cryptomeria japonica]
MSARQLDELKEWLKWVLSHALLRIINELFAASLAYRYLANWMSSEYLAKLRAFCQETFIGSHRQFPISLGDEFKEHVLKIMGGCDKQGFSMKQGVLTSGCA